VVDVMGLSLKNRIFNRAFECPVLGPFEIKDELIELAMK